MKGKLEIAWAWGWGRGPTVKELKEAFRVREPFCVLIVVFT